MSPLHHNGWRIVAGLILGICLGWTISCHGPKQIGRLTAAAAVSPAGSLTVSGECGAPAGTLVLVRAQGAWPQGAQVEQAMLVPVRDGRYLADMGLYETLEYQVTVSLSPAWNPPGLLPPPAPTSEDAELRVVQYNDTWELRRQLSFRLGTADQERLLLAAHRQRLGEALKALALSEETLRELEKTAGREGLARWLRLHLERRRGSILAPPGVDPLYPGLQSQLQQADEALMRRFHAILAVLTGAGAETDKLSAGWTAVERHLGQAREMMAELERRQAPE